MRIDEVMPKWLTGRSSTEQEQAKLDQVLKQELRKAPAVIKNLHKQVVQSVAGTLKTNPQADPSPIITKLVKDATRSPQLGVWLDKNPYTGDINNDKQLQAFIGDVVRKWYEEKVYGAPVQGAGDTPVDANKDGKDDRTGQPMPAQQAGQLPSDVKQQLDALTPQQRQELLGALA